MKTKPKCKEKLKALMKYDNGKPRFDLIPPKALLKIADVFAYGASKYEARNWEKGTSWGRYYRACIGHLNAWWSKEELDNESNLMHLAHAGCCLLMLLAYSLSNVGVDDRSKL